MQLLASSSMASAEEERERFQRSFSAPVWIESVRGLHKVRVGRCQVRADAETLRTQALGLGLADAFVVRFEAAR